MSIVPYLSIVGLIILSAFFSGSEIAYVAVNERKLKYLIKEGNKKATTAMNIYNNFESALTTILIGNNLVNIAASSISTIIIINLIGNKGVFLSTIIMTIIVLTFGEITPKIIAKTYTMKFALYAAYPLAILIKVFKPVNFIVSKFIYFISKLWKDKSEVNVSITEEEIICMIEDIEDEGIIDKERSELLQSSLMFSDIQAQEILTPRTDMLAIDIETDFEEIKDIVFNSPFSRIPVYEDSIDNIIGILHTTNFLLSFLENKEFDIRDILVEPVYIYKTMKVPNIFGELNSRQLQMGIVTDEYGGTLGCVTLEDALEELVGEIWDERDIITKEFVKIKENKFLVRGDISIRDFLDFIDLPYIDIDSDYNTVGGWTIEMFDKVPEKGEKFKFENLTIEVYKVDGTRISEILVTVNKRI